MENNKPKFRLENITKLPENASEIIKEILAEISHTKRLQPIPVKSKRILEEVCVPYVGPCATQSGHGVNYCDPHCSCNTTCSCNDHCNHCGCVDYNACPEFEGCGCHSDYGCRCDDVCSSDCNFVCHCDVDFS